MLSSQIMADSLIIKHSKNFVLNSIFITDSYISDIPNQQKSENHKPDNSTRAKD